MTTSYPRPSWPQNALQKSSDGSLVSSWEMAPFVPWYMWARDVVDCERSGCSVGSAMTTTSGGGRAINGRARDGV